MYEGGILCTFEKHVANSLEHVTAKKRFICTYVEDEQ